MFPGNLPSDRSDRDTPSKASDCDTVASSSTMPETQSGLEIIKLFSCSNQLSMKLQLLLKTKMLKVKSFTCFKTLRCCIYPAYKC